MVFSQRTKILDFYNCQELEDLYYIDKSIIDKKCTVVNNLYYKCPLGERTLYCDCSGEDGHCV